MNGRYKEYNPVWLRKFKNKVLSTFTSKHLPGTKWMHETEKTCAARLPEKQISKVPSGSSNNASKREAKNKN